MERRNDKSRVQFRLPTDAWRRVAVRVAAVGMLLPGLLWQVAGNAPLPDTSLCSFQMIVETGMEHDNAHHKRLPHGGVGVTQHPQGF